MIFTGGVARAALKSNDKLSMTFMHNTSGSDRFKKKKFINPFMSSRDLVKLRANYRVLHKIRLNDISKELLLQIKVPAN
ncbi:hypothetical protein DCC62_02385 [candidate division KSB1 bacterium]|nr:MAG: hypothetical protein DCC62_02385 [candidate division KSB1 bacterium]